MATETLWVERAGENTYRLRSVPFYAKGLSYHDIVIARVEGEALIYEAVALRGGHSTYRIFLGDGVGIDDPSFQGRWLPLERLGVTYERATARLVSIDVPPHADIHEVYRLLEIGEHQRVWEFEEGHCGHS